MAFLNGVDVSPDELVKQGRCPECARPLEELRINDHIASHWIRTPDAEGLRRINLLLEAAKAGHGVQ